MQGNEDATFQPALVYQTEVKPDAEKQPTNNPRKKNNGYYSELGRKGFEATRDKYFDGDDTNAAIWLRSKGKLIDRLKPWQNYPQEIFIMSQKAREDNEE